MHEDVVAGRIHEIDFRFPPLRISQRSADGKLALDFFLVIVRHGRAFVHLAQAIYHACGKEECGNQLRLSSVTMAYQRNIADVFTIVDFHPELLRNMELPIDLDDRARSKRTSRSEEHTSEL